MVYSFCTPHFHHLSIVRQIALLVGLLLVGAFVQAQSDQYQQLWNNPAVQQRIDSGIRVNRMGDAVLRITDKAGKSIKNATVQVKQTRHAFLFGANIFMLNGFETEAENQQFEAKFLGLFNYASAPFYWKTLEPQPGKVRFAADSEPVYRRPPPDAVLAFCQKHHLTVKGHTLVWEHPEHGIPDWLPKDTAAVARLISQRLQEITARYGQSIKIWDVVNESLKLHPGIVLPKDYVYQTFRQAAKLFPGAQLLINEVTSQSWENLTHVNSPYYLQIQNLLCRGAKIDGIGLQFHFFSEELHNRVVAGQAMQPETMFRALDLLHDFNKPVHVTEITIPTLPATAEGEAIQATLTRNFYRLWFSHPSIEAITWWNMVDETAVPGEDKWKGGLFRRNFSPKPSFDALNKLINTEWKTNLETKATSGEATFRGFYGDYEITIKRGGKTVKRTISLKKGGDNTFTIQM